MLKAIDLTLVDDLFEAIKLGLDSDESLDFIGNIRPATHEDVSIDIFGSRARRAEALGVL